jgi:hypothetical protein
MTDTSNVVPFGKHKGQTIADIATSDPAYLNWLMQQNWFVEQYQHLVINVTNFAPPSEETPAHNAMQVRFLDAEYRYAFVWAAFDMVDECEVTDDARFETIGDVTFYVRLQWSWDDGSEADGGVVAIVEIKPSLGDDFPAVLRQVKKQQERLRTLEAINKSPFGYGYGQQCAWAVLVGEYVGTGATLAQVRKMFLADGITVVLAADVESYLP